MYYQCPRFPNFSPFCSTASRFSSYKQFWESAPNDPKMTLNPTRSNVLHICVTSILDFQISVHLAVQPAVVELQAILRKFWEWLPNDLNTKGQMYPACVTSIHKSQISLFHSTTSCFWDKCTEWPKNDFWTLQGLMYPIYCYWYSQVPHFNLFRSGTGPFGDTDHFETSALNDPRMTLNTTKSKVPHICGISIHESQISVCFTLRPTVFEVQAILRKVHRMTPKWHWTLKDQRYTTY